MCTCRLIITVHYICYSDNAYVGYSHLYWAGVDSRDVYHLPHCCCLLVDITDIADRPAGQIPWVYYYIHPNYSIT